jgi:hypothetical protein
MSAPRTEPKPKLRLHSPNSSPTGGVVLLVYDIDTPEVCPQCGQSRCIFVERRPRPLCLACAEPQTAPTDPAKDEQVCGEVLPPSAPRAVALSFLAHPRPVGDRLCKVVVRIAYSDAASEFFYYRDVPEAMRAHPTARCWPFPYSKPEEGTAARRHDLPQ